MKKIDDYPNIMKLLNSNSLEDILIGISLLKEEFSYEEFVYNFPNVNTEDTIGRKFCIKGKIQFWVEIKGTFMQVDHGVIYCPKKEECSVEEWRIDFPEEEIQL